jgi:hypothetical protein
LRLLKIKGTTIEAVITQGMSRSNLVDTTFQISANPEIAKDLVVFDAESKHGIWRRRIWALRESKLPIRLSEWSPMGGRYETLISYSKEEQPEEFFDPDAFEAELKDMSNSIISLMYMFYRDPGEIPIPTAEN